MKLPAYLTIEDIHHIPTNALRQKARKIDFPLSAEDEESAKILEAKFDSAQNRVGLAAPQIGVSKCMIMLEIPDSAHFKKWRPDLTDSLSKTLWINPSFKPLNDEKHSDYEACLSVTNNAGVVKRYKHIKYLAYLKDGTKVQGTASGFLARVIQHEIDHLEGKCFFDAAEIGSLMSMENYIELRSRALSLPEY